MKKKRSPASPSRAKRAKAGSRRDGAAASDAFRKVLRDYRVLVRTGGKPGPGLRTEALEALHYFGGDADRESVSLRDYDHVRYGPFLGVSEDGVTADDVCRAARSSPKGRALGANPPALDVGVSVDADRVGGP